MTASTTNDNKSCNGVHTVPPSSPILPKPSSIVYRVAITGGPCAGKTTALAEIAERLRSRGFGVFIVPEAATLMFTGGASLANASDEHIINFQTQLLRTQITLENTFINLASTSRQKETFVLCDRGACDGRAYMSPTLWDKLLIRNQWHMVDIRDARYDLVVHLVTAANGARDHYTLANNKVRSETPEIACQVDKKTQMAWVGHPHLRIVDNRTGFREKINRVDAFISQLAGLHLSKRIVRKFLLRSAPSSSAATSTSTITSNCSGTSGNNSHDGTDGNGFINNNMVDIDGCANLLSSCDNIDTIEQVEWWTCVPLDVEHFHVEQTFLSTGLGDDVQESIRRRGKNGVFTYVHKIRRGDSETKRQITVREYNSLLAHSDNSRATVRISRKCFLDEGTYFVLDCVCNVTPKIRLLRCHQENADEHVQIPKWFNIEREVTGEPNFSMHAIATRCR